jgi:hypothetical protein
MSDLLLKGFKTFHSFDVLQQLLNNEKIKALKQNPKFSQVESMDIVDSFVFHGKRERKESSFKKGKGIVLTNKTKDVVVRVIKDDITQDVKVSSLSLETNNDETYLNAYEINEDNELYLAHSKVFTPEVKEEFESNFVQMFEEERNIDKDQIETQDWLTDGCLPGGYLWCGKGCSNYPDKGGDGTVLNSTDACCKTHDYCYRYDWDTVDGCDDALCSCVQNKDTIAAFFIRLWFCD